MSNGLCSNEQMNGLPTVQNADPNVAIQLQRANNLRVAELAAKQEAALWKGMRSDSHLEPKPAHFDTRDMEDEPQNKMPRLKELSVSLSLTAVSSGTGTGWGNPTSRNLPS